MQSTQTKGIIKGITNNRLNEQQRKRLQHELKIYMEQYFKRTLGKSVDTTRITIVEDMLIIRRES
jgi:hypothetical protein